MKTQVMTADGKQNTQLKPLIEILEKEENLFLTLIEVEGRKKDAIIGRNAEDLLEYSKVQERFIEQIDKLELERGDFLEILALQNDLNASIRLSEILELEFIDPYDREALTHLQENLSTHTFNLKNLMSINQRLLRDSFDFFHSLLEVFSREEEMVYKLGKKEHEPKRPIFINANV